MDILIVKMSALGDVIHTLPVLTALRRHCPDARITWLVEPAAADLLQGHRALDRVLVWHRAEWQALARRWRFAQLGRHFIRFVRDLRARRFDLIIDLQGLAKSAAWVAVARGRRKAGYGRGLPHGEASWLALNERIPVSSPDVHAIERGLLLVEALGFPRLPVVFDVPIGAESEALAVKLLRQAGVDPDRPFVAINPVTRWPTKNWESAQFAAVVTALAEARIPFVLTGGSGDGPILDSIAAAAGRALPRLDGQTPLKTLAAIFRRARVVVSTDTGPMHLAAAVGTPVVALFGPTAPWRTGPYGPDHVVLRLGLECSPCFQRTCHTELYEKRACMLRLDPADVVAAVLERWKQSGERDERLGESPRLVRGA